MQNSDRPWAGSDPAPDFLEVAALYRYWGWSELMRELFDRELRARGTLELDASEGFTVTAYMTYWYGSLYVVIEGWR